MMNPFDRLKKEQLMKIFSEHPTKVFQRRLFEILYDQLPQHRRDYEFIQFLRKLGTEVGYVVGHPLVSHTNHRRGSTGCATCHYVEGLHKFVPDPTYELERKNALSE